MGKSLESLIGIPYDLNAGPRSLEEVRSEMLQKANCMSIAQMFFYTAFNLYIPPELLLPPITIANFGRPIKSPGIYNGEFFDDNLKYGDLIFGVPRIALRKRGTNFDDVAEVRRLETLEIKIHEAIYLGKPTSPEFRVHFPLSSYRLSSNNPQEEFIFHSSAHTIEKAASICSVERFVRESAYIPFAANRIFGPI